MVKSIYNKRYFAFVLMFLFLLPLIFINRQISSDWGGDFAMYINEAMNIAHFQSIDDTHYIYNENAPMLGPGIYPAGFPLMLAPICFLFGNNISVFIIYMSLLLIITALVIYVFFKDFFSAPVAAILTLTIVYNPWMLSFKNEVLADIPFTLFFILTLVFYLKKAPAWLTGIVMGFAILVKTAGFVLPVGFVLYYFYNLVKRKRYPGLVFTAIYAVIFVFVLNTVLKMPLGLGLYSGNFDFSSLKHNILINISLYIEIYQSFFYRVLHDWKFIMLVTRSAMLTFLIIGIINVKKDLIYFIFVAYVFLLLVYPYHSSGFRFLLPVMPLLLLFALYGFKSIKWRYKVDKRLIVIFAALVLLGQYFPETVKLIEKRVEILPGPQQKSSKEAFDFIKKNTVDGDVILFTKPRVLALYTGRNAVCNEISDSSKKLEELLKNKNVKYILTNSDLSNKAAERFLKQNGDKVDLIWQNTKFKFYRINQP